MNEKIADKVRKLLALSENNPSREEAESALLKAQELMVRNNLSEADLGTGKKTAVVVHLPVTEFRRPTWWEKSLIIMLAKNFRCYTYIKPQRGVGSRLVLLGFEEEAKTCKDTFDYACRFLQHQTKKFRKEVRKDKGSAAGGFTNDYLKGFLKGLGDKFEEQVRTNEWGLVLVKPQEVTNEWDGMSRRASKPSMVIRKGSEEAFSKGYAQGKSFQKPSGLIK